ncbi:39S ribosomal protein L52, mitochondrial isoform X4 [Hypanus sabinus]|uniref:39S ribosomal protein L52, mitochondrial isoform X4 n=1 Tax=Hypanus sabinus TaxID=79690 RepID=UPI0028C4ECE0|nr:39S ribosomal protein L52, mitochondrial isoform X4 [Hypanus sabinus]
MVRKCLSQRELHPIDCLHLTSSVKQPALSKTPPTWTSSVPIRQKTQRMRPASLHCDCAAAGPRYVAIAMYSSEAGNESFLLWPCVSSRESVATGAWFIPKWDRIWTPDGSPRLVFRRWASSTPNEGIHP